MNKLLCGTILMLCVLGLHFRQPLPIAAVSEADAPVSIEPDRSGREQPNDASELDQRINQWIRTISRQPGFEAWQNAEWSRAPLGPGTHGWLIHLRSGNREIGYMVVGATPEGGIALQEYGRGEHPLFSMKMLHQALVRQGLIPSMNEAEFQAKIGAGVEKIYVNALHALWKVNTGSGAVYLDAMTGEYLPLDEAKVANVRNDAPEPAAVGDAASIVENINVPSFDPFYRVNWITNKPMALEDHREFRLALHHETEITYSAQLFNRTILSAFAVTGYQEWSDDRGFVELEYDGERFVPYDTLAALGSFYQ